MEEYLEFLKLPQKFLHLNPLTVLCRTLQQRALLSEGVWSGSSEEPLKNPCGQGQKLLAVRFFIEEP